MPRFVAVSLWSAQRVRSLFCGEHYGTLSHNVKAVYQRAFGWFDGNPATLHALPRSASSPRYVAALGGVDAVVDLAQSAIDEGDLRWAAELLWLGAYRGDGPRLTASDLTDGAQDGEFRRASRKRAEACLAAARLRQS